MALERIGEGLRGFGGQLFTNLGTAALAGTTGGQAILEQQEQQRKLAQQEALTQQEQSALSQVGDIFAQQGLSPLEQGQVLLQSQSPQAQELGLKILGSQVETPETQLRRQQLLQRQQFQQGRLQQQQRELQQRQQQQQLIGGALGGDIGGALGGLTGGVEPTLEQQQAQGRALLLNPNTRPLGQELLSDVKLRRQLKIPGFQLTGGFRPTPKEAADLRKATANRENIFKNLDSLDRLIEQKGSELFATKAARRIDGIRKNLLTDLNVSADLGALSEGDREVLEGQIADPLGFSAILQTRGTFRALNDDLRGRVTQGLLTEAQSKGFTPTSAEAFGIPPVAPSIQQTVVPEVNGRQLSRRNKAARLLQRRR